HVRHQLPGVRLLARLVGEVHHRARVPVDVEGEAGVGAAPRLLSDGRIDRDGAEKYREYESLHSHLVKHEERQLPAPLTLTFVGSASRGNGFLGCWRSGTRSFEAPPGNRWMLGYLMIDWSKSMMTG